MNKKILFLIAFLTISFGSFQISSAQSFDFEKLEKIVSEVSVIINMKVEYSFGAHTNEQEERYLGSVVSEDGLVLYNGFTLSGDNPISALTGMNVKTTTSEITVTFLDGTEYPAEFVGVDRFSKIGFIKIKADDHKFKALKFISEKKYKVGDWVALYMLLPEYVQPPLSADVGMISTLIETPEEFPLIVGFNTLQMTSVLFDENLNALGVLGQLSDPSQSNTDQAGMIESFGSFGMPLLGLITENRIAKMIANPPEKGKTDRGWLGITLQALTTEMAEFWNLDITGGIIINDIASNSPAAKAGLDVGDIIFEVNGQTVEVNKEEKVPIFQRKIAEMGPSAAVEFTILKRTDDKVDTTKVLATLEKTPMTATDSPEYENEELEFTVRDLVFSDYLYHNLDAESFAGVVVSELKSGGVAEIEGLRYGDIIQRISDQEVTSVGEVEVVMDELVEQKVAEIIFFVWRNQKTLFVNVKTDF